MHFRIIITLSVFFLITALPAQDNKRRVELQHILNSEQLKMVEQQRETIQFNREVFLKTFSEEQLILHQQKDVPRMERRKALTLSFSLEQKEMLKAQRAKLKK